MGRQGLRKARKVNSMRFILFAIALCGASQNSMAAENPIIPYEIVHFSSGKMTLGGELFKPKGEGPFPAVLYNHGSVEGMKSDMASTAMGPLYVAKGWIFFMP